MSETSEVEQADRVGRKRARLFLVQAALFLGWQGLFFSSPPGDPMRAVSAVKLSAWLVWVLLLLLLLATGGGLLRYRKLRGLLNDELTRQHRTAGFVAGFWVAVVACVGLYVIEMFEPVTGREAVHVILSLAIASALVTFAVLERRTAGGR